MEQALQEWGRAQAAGEDFVLPVPEDFPGRKEDAVQEEDCGRAVAAEAGGSATAGVGSGPERPAIGQLRQTGTICLSC